MTQIVDGEVAGGRWTRQGVIALGVLALYAGVLAAAWFAIAPFIPEEVTLGLFGFEKTVEDVPSRILRDGSLLFAILPFAFWVEWIVVGTERSSLKQLLTRPTASMKTDVAMMLLGQAHILDIATKVMMLGASMISGLAIRDWITAHTGISISAAGLPFAVQLVLFFYVYTFFDYWTHRIDHGRLFWPLHRYHHSAEDFCVLTTSRQHPVEFVGVFVMNVPLAILGASPEVMIFINVLVTTIGFLIHSQMTSDWGWVGRWIIQSPQHHRLHHKLDMTEKTGHFGMAPVWDRLFGTWYDNAAKYPEIGVAKPYRHGLWIVPDVLRDYFDFWKGFFVRNTDPA